MSEIKPFIVCENMVKIFKIADTEVLALQGLDLTIYEGELIGVVGTSGSGKSTLMNVLGGLTRPSAGKVIVDGRNLLNMNQRELDTYRQVGVGFVWQQAMRNLIPYLTALENVMLPMTLAGLAGGVVRKRATDLLGMVDLTHRLDKTPVTLSGGEQQRVAIAVALANQPRLLLADEPTGELDSTNSDMVYALFRELNKTLGITTIIVSHDPQIARHVQRVIAIRDGKTAGETVRKRQNGASHEEYHSAHFDEEQYEELIALDSAGRLQIPKEYREQLSMTDRVRMEMTDGKIIVHPVHDLAQTSMQAQIESEIEPEGVAKPRSGWLTRFTSSKGRKNANYD